MDELLFFKCITVLLLNFLTKKMKIALFRCIIIFLKVSYSSANLINIFCKPSMRIYNNIFMVYNFVSIFSLMIILFTKNIKL